MTNAIRRVKTIFWKRVLGIKISPFFRFARKKRHTEILTVLFVITNEICVSFPIKPVRIYAAFFAVLFLIIFLSYHIEFCKAKLGSVRETRFAAFIIPNFSLAHKSFFQHLRKNGSLDNFHESMYGLLVVLLTDQGTVPAAYRFQASQTDSLFRGNKER